METIDLAEIENKEDAGRGVMQRHMLSPAQAVRLGPEMEPSSVGTSRITRPGRRKLRREPPRVSNAHPGRRYRYDRYLRRPIDAGEPSVLILCATAHSSGDHANSRYHFLALQRNAA